MSGHQIEGQAPESIKLTYPHAFKKLSFAFAIALTGMAVSTLVMA